MSVEGVRLSFEGGGLRVGCWGLRVECWGKRGGNTSIYKRVHVREKKKIREHTLRTNKGI